MQNGCTAARVYCQREQRWPKTGEGHSPPPWIHQRLSKKEYYSWIRCGKIVNVFKCTVHMCKSPSQFIWSMTSARTEIHFNIKFHLLGQAKSCHSVHWGQKHYWCGLLTFTYTTWSRQDQWKFRYRTTINLIMVAPRSNEELLASNLWQKSCLAKDFMTNVFVLKKYVLTVFTGNFRECLFSLERW